MLRISFPNGIRLDLEYSEEEITGGQHGSPLVFQDRKSLKKFVLKPFFNAIDAEFSQLNALDVDLSWEAARSKDRGQFGRIANELVASRVAAALSLNVPHCFPVVSTDVASFKIEPKTKLSLDPEVKVLDESGKPETYEEFYRFQEREIVILDTSTELDDIMFSRRTEDYPPDPSFIVGILSEFIPNSHDLATRMDKASEEKRLDEWVDELRAQDSGYYLLPFDTWLNDPDRNNQNYLIQEKDGESTIWGIDYEMFSFGGDIPDEDDITKGRSYLAAMLHKSTSLEDPRILQTLLKIKMLSEEAIAAITRLPFLLIQYVEYHIAKGNLDMDAREKIRSTEENLFDCLWETKPKMSRLELTLKEQIGSPKWEK
ncbi:MAG: hypothetical protein ACXACI_02365 [Candidatus Hodarchaeales archaeon]|jgi:hypothetical protein